MPAVMVAAAVAAAAAARPAGRAATVPFMRNWVPPHAAPPAKEEATAGAPRKDLNPVVFVAPMCGTKIAQTWAGIDVPQGLCAKDENDLYETWISAGEVVPGAVDCMMNRMKVVWNDSAKAYADRGVKDVIAGGAYGEPPGNTGVPGQASVGNGLIVPLFLAPSQALKTLGYDVGSQMKVVPYDWRMGPKQFLAPGGDYEKMKKLVESFYASTNRKVILSGLSMAGFFTHRFLTAQTQEWRDRYIAGWVSVAGYWAGVYELMNDVISGEAPYVPWLKADRFRDMVGDWGAFAAQLPRPTGNATFDAAPRITTPARTYTAAQTRDALLAAVPGRRPLDAGQARRTVEVYDWQYDDSDVFGPPGVDVWCFYSSGIDTMSAGKYQTADLSDTPEVIMGDGDGTVHEESLAVCEQWQAKDPKHKITTKKYSGISHASMFMDLSVLGDFVAAVAEMNGVPLPPPTPAPPVPPARSVVFEANVTVAAGERWAGVLAGGDDATPGKCAVDHVAFTMHHSANPLCWVGNNPVQVYVACDGDPVWWGPRLKLADGETASINGPTGQTWLCAKLSLWINNDNQQCDEAYSGVNVTIRSDMP